MAVIKDKNWLESLCRAYTEKNVKTLGGWAVGDNIDPELKMRAIAMLFERGWGRPTQDNNHSVSGEVRVVLRKMLEEEEDDG